MGDFEWKGETLCGSVYVHECCIFDENAPHNSLVEGCKSFKAGICWVYTLLSVKGAAYKTFCKNDLKNEQKLSVEWEGNIFFFRVQISPEGVTIHV